MWPSLTTFWGWSAPPQETKGSWKWHKKRRASWVICTWVKLYVLGWVGWDWNVLLSCSRRNLEESGDGRVGTLVVLDADWSVITKYGRFFDLMNINELSRSVPATFSARSAAARAHINFSLVTQIPLLSQALLWALTNQCSCINGHFFYHVYSGDCSRFQLTRRTHFQAVTEIQINLQLWCFIFRFSIFGGL